ncbi:MAG: hypothetical protein ACP5G3_04365 [Sulfurihydrogenibium sp.]|uniref:hypothetical protein n=1 Tax=Sulfurihydrogenibium sp. TaxID=2053621 RepID=UPI000CB40742|nr:MAG: hypothetical protein C0198_04300 [Sulfurihydrogenibium sp.]PMP78069.1 MAG: hypothetical protein C0178_00285 [Sulfurihydrogenibium sp.]
MLGETILKYWKIILGVGIVMAVGGLFLQSSSLVFGKIVEFFGFSLIAIVAYVLGYKNASDEAEKQIKAELEKLAKQDIRYKFAADRAIKNLKAPLSGKK